MSESMSLFAIEDGLLEMFRMLEDPELSESERANIEVEITAYVTARLQKVDGIAAFIDECETRAQIEKEESARIAKRAKRWAQMAERVKESAIYAMQAAEMTKIEGRHHTLKLRSNPPSVDIRQPELVPDEFKGVTLKVWKPDLIKIAEACRNAGVSIILDGPETALAVSIKNALKKGEAVPGCTMKQGVRLVIE